MYVIFDYLQKYNFDPRPLLNSSLKLAHKRLEAALEKDPSLIDDLLVGVIQDEMVQPLRVSQPHSTRAVLPLRFTNDFEVIDNNVKAICYAFDLKDTSGQPIFNPQEDTPTITYSDQLIDMKVNGTLATPSFNSAKHVAAVLSTALLVAEQMILEQLLPTDNNEPNTNELGVLLEQIMGENEAADVLSLLCSKISEIISEDSKPDLGAQFEYCQPLIELLRSSLNINTFPSLLIKLTHPGVSTAEVMEQLTNKELEGLTRLLTVLFHIGNHLQSCPLTTGKPENSRGINAGLVPLIAHLNPHLAASLQIPIESIMKANIPAINKELVRDRVSTQAFLRCPFLANQHRKQTAPREQVSENQESSATVSQYSIYHSLWSKKGIIGAAVAGAAAVVAGMLINS